jgi:micrococcal nuclease
VDPVLRRLFRIGLTLGLLGGVAFALTKALGGKRPGAPERGPSARPLAPEAWPPLQPDPGLAEPEPSTALEPDPEAPTVLWVEPSGDVCPTTHPVKAKLSSKIFHLPGMLNYDRTKPDRCYRDGDAAEADGLRPAKR